MSSVIVNAVLEAKLPEDDLRERFYEDIVSEGTREFIQGEIVRQPPPLNRHLMATTMLYGLMNAHVATRRLGSVHVGKAMTCFPRNDYEPDVMFFGTAKLGLITPDTLRFPIPDLIVEVLSPSTEKRDRGIKFTDYALHGVPEYWIIDTVAETVELYRLDEDAYPPVQAQNDGVLVSDVVAGFEIPVKAIFDEKANAEVMRAIWAKA